MERQSGYYARALASFEESWALSKSATGPAQQALASRALAENVDLNARLGRRQRLDELFAELKQSAHPISGFATEKIVSARQAVWMMQYQPDKAYRCGAMALNRMVAHVKPGAEMQSSILEAKSTERGMSLAQVWSLSRQIKEMPALQMVKRAAGSSPELPAPAIVHWQAGHYAALIEKGSDGRYLVDDPTFGNEHWMTKEALDEEASGYLLVLEGHLPGGWSAMAEAEGNSIFGKGTVAGQNPDRTGCQDTKVASGTGCKLCNQGMPGYDVHAMTVSLAISDTPMSYKPPLGSAIGFTAFYAQREANQAPSQFWSLGPKWTCNWYSTITDYGYYAPDGLSAPYYHRGPSDPKIYLQGGGMEYASNGTLVSQGPVRYQYGPAPESRARLVQNNEEGSSYTRYLPDGTVQEFDLSTPVSNVPLMPHTLFLTKEIDPQGHRTLYTYDGDYRLVAVTDAVDQVTSLRYRDDNYPKQPTAITDPFGRRVDLYYNEGGQLESITDVMAQTSSFSYGDNDFIESMTTLYGITSFAYGDSTTDPSLGVTRWLEVTDPLGNKERTEFRQGALGIPVSEPLVPDMPVFNSYLDARNSFFWDKAAYADAKRGDGTFDYTKARLFHWLHDTGGTMASGIIESTKEPLERRVWYFYQGQISPGSANASMTRNPSHIGRVLDDGSTQLTQHTYNTLGRVLTSTDPLGRVLKFDYSDNDNGTDLKAVHRLGTSASPINEVILQMEYNGWHQPTQIIDAAGQLTELHYTGDAQLREAINARYEVTTFTYTSNYLTSIEPSGGGGAQIVFGYDDHGRPNQITGLDGFTVMSSYDDLNRPVTATYPDGSFTQAVYDRMHVAWSQDRAGNWTQYLVNPLRQLQLVRDPNGGTVQYDWCGCGTLLSLTDGNGYSTLWIPDGQGRTRYRRGGDGYWTTYTYENSTSRLKAIEDARGQITNYQYNQDDTLAGVSYSNAHVATPGVSFAYDPLRGRLETMTDGTGTTAYGYYGVGVPGADQVQTVQGPLTDSTITLDYDKLGRMNSMDISGTTQTLDRDGLGRVEWVNNALGYFAFQYDPATKRVSEIDAPNSSQSRFTYSDISAPGHADITVQQIQNLGPTGLLSQFDYEYDVMHRITGWARQLERETDRYDFRYDPLGQLLRATRTQSGGDVLSQSGYSYDDAGNRVSEQNGTALVHSQFDGSNAIFSTAGGGPVRFAGQLSKPATLTVGGVATQVDSRNRFETNVNLAPGPQTVTLVATDPIDHSTVTRNYQVEVTAGNPRAYTRDENGNITGSSSPDGSGSPNTTYEWDAADRLVAINTSTHRTEIEYDGLGRRVHLTEKENGSVASEKRFLWCGNELCEERAASGRTVKRFFGQGEERVNAGATGLYFYTRDHVGSVREMTDSSGTVRARYDYMPWGSRVKTEGDLDCDFGFTGFYFHDPSGLNFSRTRAYDSVAAKWLSRDPIGQRGGPNLYGYVGNAPINYYDSLGLTPEAAGAVLAGGLIVLGGEEAGGWVFGGNFNPVVDIILAGTAIGIGVLVLWEYFQPEAAQPNYVNAQAKPKNCPPGTVPIDTPEGRTRLPAGVKPHDVKRGFKGEPGAGATDWVGVDPDGNIITAAPDGKAINNGPPDINPSK
jgi:RHS repeat-associated protein